jgi:hypothetical protein
MAPPIPGTPSAAAAGYTSAQISWRKVQNQQSGQGNINYLLFRDGNQILKTKDNDFADTGLLEGTTYVYTVASIDQSGTSAQSPGASITTGKQVLFKFDADLIMVGPGSPVNAVIASPPTIWLRTDGGANTTLYVKESGIGTSTGWVAK